MGAEPRNIPGAGNVDGFKRALPAKLAGRPGRSVDRDLERRAFSAIAAKLAADPDGALHEIAAAALQLCSAEGALIAQVQGTGLFQSMRRCAQAGKVAGPPDGGIPCTEALAEIVRRNELTLICSENSQFTDFSACLDPHATEILLLPLAMDGPAAGVIFLSSRSTFNAEDARVAAILSDFGSTAWQLRAARAETDGLRQQLNESRKGEVRLRDLFRQAPGFMAILRGPTHVFEFYNHAYERLVGFRKLIGRPVRAVFPEIDGQGFLEWLDAVYRTGSAHLGHATPLRLQAAPDQPVTEHFIDFIYQAITDGSGQTTGIFVEGHDVSDQVRSATALKASETRLRTLTENIPQLVWRADPQWARTWSSPQWQSYTGQELPASLGSAWLDAVHPDDHAGVVEGCETAGATGQLDVEHRLRRASDGRWLWHHTRALPMRNATGELVEWVGTSTDIQQLKEMQERQRILVGELQHRTRNLIAVVRGIAAQTLAVTPSMAAFSTAFNDRLAALARVQGLLSRSSEAPIRLDEIITMELDSVGAFAGQGPAVSMQGPRVHVQSSIVQTLALAFHELATNARKHGALASGDGTLQIHWYLADRAGHEPTLAIEWIEERPPSEGDPFPADGFGRFLIEKALPHLGAATCFELRANGARCDIRIPLRSEHGH